MVCQQEKKSLNMIMKLIDLLQEVGGVGLVVKGVNTTPDVHPGEIPRQARKFGNQVDQEGRPPVARTDGKIDEVEEGHTNLAEGGDLPSEVEAFILTLGPDDVGVEEIGDYRIHYEGFSDWCKQDAQERCSLPPHDPRHLATYDDVYDEVLADFQNREHGAEPVATGFAGSDNYPVAYAVFARQVAENFANGRGPGRPGDSQRHGIPKNATMAELKKATRAPGRKGQLARWQINMRRGRERTQH